MPPMPHTIRQRPIYNLFSDLTKCPEEEVHSAYQTHPHTSYNSCIALLVTVQSQTHLNAATEEYVNQIKVE